MRKDLMIKRALLVFMVVVFIIFTIILTFIYKTVVSKKINLLLLESTNLSNVKIDSATINDKIDVLNLNKYTLILMKNQ